LPADAAITIDWPDLGSSPDIKFIHLDDALNFKDLSFDQILAAFQALVGYLGKLKGFGFLNDKIPLVNASVGDMLDWTQKFADKLQMLRDHPAGSLQELEQAISDNLGVTPVITLDSTGKVLDTKFVFTSGFTFTKDLNFDLKTLLDHVDPGNPVLALIENVVNISGSTSL